VFCADRVDWIDYKDVNLLRKYMSDRGKIRARRVSGNCSQHQRKVAIAIKTARELALLPYSQRTVSERGGRGRGGGRGSSPTVETGGPVPDPQEAESLMGAGGNGTEESAAREAV
jgi:small subunit ribosomal protein S18